MREFNYGIDTLSVCMARASGMGCLANSITGGRGNLVGFIGEEVFRLMHGGKYSQENGEHYEWDIVMPSGKTIDVKTKSCTGVPRDTYNATVAKFNTNQACDIYAFVRVEVGKRSKIPTGRAWYMGAIEKEDFYRDAIFYSAGDIDPESDLGWRFSADCYNMKYGSLRSK